MAKSDLVHAYCDAVERDPAAHPIQAAHRIDFPRDFHTAADLYGYTVCSYDSRGEALSPAAPMSDVAWILFDNVYARTSGGRWPANAVQDKARRAGFVAKGGFRGPAEARMLWAGAVQQFGAVGGTGTPPEGGAIRQPAAAAPAPRATPPATPEPPARPVVPGSFSEHGPAPIERRIAVSRWAQDIVDETHARWLAVRDRMVTGASGFAVFYSPVGASADLVIIGANPGGGPENFVASRARTIPAAHDYFEYDYPLARRMRKLFDNAHRTDALRSSVKLNWNFFRSRSTEEWNSNPSDIRADLEGFCAERVRETIDRLRPKVLLCESMATYDRLTAVLAGTGPRETLVEAKGRRACCRVAYGGGAIVGILHPTGAKVSNDTWAKVAIQLERML